MISREFEERCISQSWPFIEVRGNLKEGKGLFAKQDILPFTVLCNYGGKVVTQAEANLELLPDPQKCCYLLEFNEIRQKSQPENLYLNHDDKTSFTFGKFINHSSIHPNSKFKVVIRWTGFPDILFVALRQISQGEEVTWDYGKHFSGLEPCVSSCKFCLHK